MTATAELLTDLQALGVVLAADGDRLRFHPRGKVTPDLLAQLRDCKAELLSMLQPGYSGNGYGTPSEPEENGGCVAVASVADPRDAVAVPRARPTGDGSQPQDNRQPLALAAAAAPRPRFAVRVAVEWPGPAADFVLLLAPDDLPPVPFRLNAWTEVRDAAKMLRWLRKGIQRGPSGSRARYGALQRDLEELQRFALAASDRRQQDRMPPR